jgi:hypothetical protein
VQTVAFIHFLLLNMALAAAVVAAHLEHRVLTEQVPLVAMVVQERHQAFLVCR